MNEYKTKFEEAQRCINDFNLQKAKLQTENGTMFEILHHICILISLCHSAFTESQFFMLQQHIIKATKV